MIKKNIQCFSTIKELLYHSATVFANNIAFTEKVKQNNETVYIDHTYTNLLDDINAFGTSLYELGLQGKRVAVIGHNCYQWSIAHLSKMLLRKLKEMEKQILNILFVLLMLLI